MSVVGVEDVLVGDFEVAELTRDLGVGDHGAARDDDLASGVDGRIAHLLNSVDVAGEGRHDDALLGAG